MDPFKKAQISTQVRNAFGDCQQSGFPLRAIEMTPTEPMSVLEAQSMMLEALPRDYNDFHVMRVFPSIFATYPEVQVRIARDQGPVLHLVGDKEKLRELFSISRSQLLSSGCLWVSENEIKMKWM